MEANYEPSEMDIIFYGLQSFNSSNTGGSKPRYVFLTVRDSENTIVGGLIGKTYVAWLYVQALWLPENLRGQGYGRSLMLAAEKEALDRGCGDAWLDTFSFQALPFYTKLGYRVFAELPNFPPGGAKYFLTKSLR